MSPLRSRGLAATAVASLALTGLVTATGPAGASDSARADGVELIAPFNEGRWISTRFDGDDAIRLGAVVPVDTDTDGVAFSWNTDPAAGPTDEGWRNATGEAVSFTSAGFAGVDWEPTRLRPGSTIALRVAVTDTAGTTYDVLNDVRVAADESARQTVRFGGFNTGGVFRQPYASSGRTADVMAVNGTTSARSGSVELSWRDGDGAFVGQTQAAVEKNQLKVSNGNYVRGGRFYGVLDVTGYDASSPGVVVGAERGTDTAQAIGSERLEISGMGAASDVDRDGNVTRSYLYVYSGTGGRIVPGAEVMRLADDGTSGTLVGYTDGRGGLVVDQAPDTTETYYVNTTDDDDYDSDVDFTINYTQPGEQTRYGVVLDPADGFNFDPDEYAPGDLSAVAYGDDGRPAPGQTVKYRVYPDDGSTPPGTWQTAVADSTGRVVLDFTPPAAATRYRVDSAVTTDEQPEFFGNSFFSVGDATLSLSPDTPQTVGSGRSRAVTGTLANRFGTLGGRRVDLSFTPGSEPDWADGADAGIFRGSNRPPLRAARVVTEPNGSFRTTVADPVEGGLPAELGGFLAVLAPGADAGGNVAFDFRQRRDTARLVLGGEGNGENVDALRVSAPAWASGLEVRFQRVAADGTTTRVAARTLDADGDATANARDRNGPGLTTYVVKLGATDRTKPSTSNELTRR